MVFVTCALLAAFAIIYTLYVRPEHLPSEPPAEPERQYLNDKKQVIYDNLRDLHLEYRMGKLSDADYAQLKAHFQTELARVIKELVDYTARQAFKPETEARPAAGTCPHCGCSNPSSNQFCGRCGARLASTGSA